ncbi:hypothetical protein BKK49_05535 [Rodentibacter rarus]|uniref:Uncharacterized protein n=1 Tax=Rodentibacter rarus TaxID=1908260 RepID=A0A1V3IKB2_9PAST|nr:hypothetical protein BKK49_05535 [Rodentibacter rarus]OOF41998.1 hypothetical protein BKK50_07845 [Rodentibacter rarus]
MIRVIICLILIAINFLYLIGNQLFIKYSLEEYNLKKAILLSIENEMDKLSILAILNLIFFIITLFLREKK